MNTILLANTIRAFALSNYIPFQGFNEELIVNKAQKYLAVSRHDVLVALEYLANK